jgi:hypothetical protein
MSTEKSLHAIGKIFLKVFSGIENPKGVVL